jgi:DNA repair photolyase
MNVAKDGMGHFAPRLFETQTSGSFAEDFDCSIEPYAGCSFGCAFCFVPHKTDYSHEPARWGKWRKNQGIDVLPTELPAVASGAVILLAGRTDAWQPAERKREITRKILQKLVALPFEFMLVSTRSTLIERDIDLLEQIRERVLVSISINTDDAELSTAIEPNTPPPSERLRVAKLLLERGIPVRIAIAPVLRHSPKFFDGLLRSVPSIWIDRPDPAARLRPEIVSSIYDGSELTSLLKALRLRFGAERISFGRDCFSGRPRSA